MFEYYIFLEISPPGPEYPAVDHQKEVYQEPLIKVRNRIERRQVELFTAPTRFKWILHLPIDVDTLSKFNKL
jgi:hypothetical protein